MVTQKVWDTLIGVLEDVHGRPGARVTPGAIGEILKKAGEIEGLYIAGRILPELQKGAKDV